MNKITVEEIKRLNAERTQGEWQSATISDGHNSNPYYYHSVFCNERNLASACGIAEIDKNNADFIAAAPRIAALCIEQAEEIERLRETLEWYADNKSYEYVGNVKHAVTPVHCDMGFRAKEALGDQHG